MSDVHAEPVEQPKRTVDCSSYIAYSTTIRNAGGLLDPARRCSSVTPGAIIRDAGAFIDRGLDDA